MAVWFFSCFLTKDDQIDCFEKQWSKTRSFSSHFITKWRHKAWCSDSEIEYPPCLCITKKRKEKFTWSDYSCNLSSCLPFLFSCSHSCRERGSGVAPAAIISCDFHQQRRLSPLSLFLLYSLLYGPKHSLPPSSSLLTHGWLFTPTEVTDKISRGGGRVIEMNLS